MNTKHLYDLIQCWTNVEDVGPTLYKGYTNALCLLGRWTFPQCWFNVGPASHKFVPTLKQHWVNVSFKQYLVISLVDAINAVTLYSRLLYAYSPVLYICYCKPTRDGPTHARFVAV